MLVDAGDLQIFIEENITPAIVVFDKNVDKGEFLHAEVSIEKRVEELDKLLLLSKHSR